MTDNTTNTPMQEAEEQELDLVALLLKYLFYWKWFVGSVLLCLVLAVVYLRFQTPEYQVNASVLIKEEGKNSPSANNPLAAMQDFGMLTMTSNFDNEVEILKSRTLVKKVVTDLGLYINVFRPQTFGYDVPLYKNSPLQVYMTPMEAEQLPGTLQLDLRCQESGKLKTVVEYVQDREEVKLEQTFDKLPAVFPTPVGVVTITPRDTTAFQAGLHLRATIATPTATATAYVRNLSVSPTSKTTTIAQISLKTLIKPRGVDFVNYLVLQYNRDANDEKNEVAQKTAEFIQERIGIINQELGSTESRLADFKQRSGLTNLTSDAQLALQENSKYEQLRIENATQIRLVQYLRNYINNPANIEEVLPANVGLQDMNLASLIEQYNSMIIERKRLLRTSSENNPAVIHLNTGIEAMRRTVNTSVNSVLEGLEIAKADIDRQATKYESRINAAPTQEKEYMNISRQQEIQAALYTMLLQKREENAITLASTANNGRIIEDALAGVYPVAPKKMMILLVAFVLGLAIPVAVIFVLELLKFRIENHKDVEAITKVPLIAELPKAKQMPSEGAIVVQENHNETMEESFRALRTNLLFMLDKEQKVILFTSSQPGEGKSFTVGNTAVSLAFLGKKVLVMGMDIRKPGLNKVFAKSRKEVGITNYLSRPEDTDLFSLIQPSQISPNLDILFGGPVPPNPTELVSGEPLEHALERLKQRYDYILLDTAPIAMVTDTAIIARVADLCVYVCRADYTPKAAFEYVNVLQRERKISKLAVVLNDLDLDKRKNNYGYGYGGKYGYGNKYGYGSKYGYGYGYEKNKK